MTAMQIINIVMKVTTGAKAFLDFIIQWDDNFEDLQRHYYRTETSVLFISKVAPRVLSYCPSRTQEICL